MQQALEGLLSLLKLKRNISRRGGFVCLFLMVD
jgi:hypothetical protein